MANSRRQAILVLGMHRSGTSAVTRVLNLMGADIPGKLLAPQDDNPLGYWEPADIVAIHSRMLYALGTTWHDPLPLAEAWYSSQEAKRYADELLDVLWRTIPASSLFVIKDPRMCKFVPLWREVLARFGAEARFLLNVRHPLEVAESLRKRNHFGFEKGLLLWLLNMIHAERETRSDIRVIVGYEELLNDWKGCVGRIGEVLGIKFPKNVSDIEEQVEESLRGSMRHHRYAGGDLGGFGAAGDWVSVFYSCLKGGVRGERRTIDVATLDRIGTEIEINLRNLQPVLAEQARAVADVESRFETLNALLEKTRQDLQAKTAESERRMHDLEQERKDARAAIDGYEAVLARERTQAHAAAQEYEAVLARERTQAEAAIEHHRGEAERHRTDADRQREEADRHRQQAIHYRGEASHYMARLEATHRSLSWRITAPLRYAKLQAWRARRGLLQAVTSARSTVSRLLSTSPHNAPLRMPQSFEQGGGAAPDPSAIGAARAEGMADSGSYEDLDGAFSLDPAEPAAADRNALEFAYHESPLVSVIIPVFNHADYTLACLKSIERTCRGLSFEIIVIDDASEDGTQTLMSGIKGIRYFRNDTNCGFLKSGNRGAEVARGRYLLFLNNDTIVQRGWMEELVKTIEEEERAGLVGSQLLNADGSVQEAGGIIWSDGSGWNYGRGGDRRQPELNYLREASYCSAASLLVPAQLFSDLGKFDEIYGPAYYEDTDLAFKIRHAGRRVLYQPLSRVVHFEGISCGRDLANGVKRNQVRNQEIFREKWSEVLAGLAPGPGAHFSPDVNARQRILVIDAYTPTPDRDSGSVDAFFLMKFLVSYGCAVTFIPENLMLFRNYTADLQRIGVKCVYLPFITSIPDYLKQHGRDFDAVMLTRVDVASKLIDTVRKYCPAAKVVFITVDLHFLRQEREAETRQSDRLEKYARLTRDREMAAMKKSDLTILKSSDEQRLIGERLPECRTFLLPLIIDTPNRVTIPFHERRDFIFLGGFSHPPNVDAVNHLVQTIWPNARQGLTDAKLFIVGSNMPPEIHGIQAEGVEVVGYVKDLSGYLNRCRVMVAPLRYGAGVKGKIGRGLGYGLPCVASSVAVEGMGIRDGEQVIVADEDAEFAEACVRLHNDQELWTSLSARALDFFEEEISLEAGRARIADLLRVLFPDDSAWRRTAGGRA